MLKKLIKFTLLILIIGVIAYLYKSGHAEKYFSFEYLKTHQSDITAYYEANTVKTLALYFLVYVIFTALSLPLATVLTLGAGALFGLLVGSILVSFASTIGSTLAFLLSRFFLKDWVQDKFHHRIAMINEGVEKEGAFYLFTLRMIPPIPFFVINLVMGLTPIKTLTFLLVSQVGMLAGTLVYVNAGTQLAEIDSLRGILSWQVALSFSLLGIFPILAKKIVNAIRAGKVYGPYKKPKKFDYNMVVIGAGSAGLVTAYISAAVKAKVALIERHQMGGDCLNTGCVPSKALIRSARVVHYGNRAQDYGLKKTKIEFDFAEVMKRVQTIIKKIEPHDSVERYTGLGVECIQGEAKIISPWEVKVGDRVLTAKNITIATGARPFVPPIPGLDKVAALTSDTLWDLREQPKKFVVLGGGPIGCEMAQSFARLGSQVTLIEGMDRIIGIEDPEVSEIIQEQFKKEGITLLLNHLCKEFVVKEGKQLALCEKDGAITEVEFDQVLISVGRKANVGDFGLEELGVNIRKNGTIEANEFLQTNFPNIFVCGDVTGPFQLTHTASHQAWYCAVNGLFGKFKKFKVDYDVIPWCTYTDPEVATVGMNEKSAKAQNINYEVTTYGIDDLDRAIADSEDKGLVKVLTLPGSDKILGATIVGNHASDLLLEFISAKKLDFGLNDILGTIHTYPTMGEANKYLAGNWKRKQVSEKTLSYLKKFHRWMRS